jgi:hypothetical protein
LRGAGIEGRDRDANSCRRAFSDAAAPALFPSPACRVPASRHFSAKKPFEKKALLLKRLRD